MKNAETSKAPFLEILLDKFEECEDFRDPDRLYYTLSEILFLTFCGSVGGCESYQEIVDYGKMKISWLRKYLSYEHGIPSHDTIGRAMSLLNPKCLEKILSEVCQLSLQLENGSIINIDGKRINRSATKAEQQLKKSKGGKQSINMVNVYCDAISSCLSSIKVGGKVTEKDSLEEILELLDLSGCLLTFDAGFCHKVVTKQVVESESDYLIGLKMNQPNLYEAAEDLLRRCPAVEQDKAKKESSHGREEQRICKVLNFSNLESDYLSDYQPVFDKWTGIQSLIKIESHRFLKAENKKTIAVRYYISSKEMMPKKANEIIRSHWKVENKLHWILDAIMGEDRSTKRGENSAQNFSIFRKLAFNKLKAYDDPKVSMNRRMRKCMMDEKYFEDVLQIS